MRHFILMTTTLLLVVAVSGQAGAADNLSLRLKAQQERMALVDRMAEKDRAVAEAQYAEGVDRLLDAVRDNWMSTRAILQGRDVAAQVILAEFARMSTDKAYAYGYFDASALAFPSRPEVVEMRNGLMDVYFGNAIRQFVTDDNVYLGLTELAQSKRLTLDTHREVRRLLAIVDKARLDLQSLQDQRDGRRLAVNRWERLRKTEVLQAISALKKGTASTGGVVTTTGSDANGLFCLIEGIDTPLRIGTSLKTATVSGIKIVAISSEMVRFSQGGTAWEQELGAPADSHWTR